jgi:hypothetical protein
MVGFAFISPGHAADTSASAVIASGGCLDFVRETLHVEPTTLSSWLQLWATSREEGELAS